MPLAWAGAWLGLGLVVLLIAAMGGRLVGAAASGAAQRSGGARIAPRPGLERGLLALLALGFTAEALGRQGMPAAAPLAAGALLLGVRLVSWLPGLRRSQGDVLAVAAGQAWLCVGLLARAAAEVGLLPFIPASSALHLATVGGIGGTTLVMAMRASAQREARPMPVRAAPTVAALMGVAALLRAFGPPEMYAAAALVWTLATLVAAGSVFAPPGRRWSANRRPSGAAQHDAGAVMPQDMRLHTRQLPQRRGDSVLGHQGERRGQGVGQCGVRRQDRDGPVAPRAAAGSRVEQMGEPAGGVEDEAAVAGGGQSAVHQFHLAPDRPGASGSSSAARQGRPAGWRRSRASRRDRPVSGSRRRARSKVDDAIGDVALGDAVQRHRHAPRARSAMRSGETSRRRWSTSASGRLDRGPGGPSGRVAAAAKWSR